MAELIEVPAGGSREPCTPDTFIAGRHYFTMDGRRVREFVNNEVPPLIKQFLHDNGVGPNAIIHLVPHQANGVILEELAPRLGLPHAQLHTTVHYYGNTGAASIPITLDQATRACGIEPGEYVLLAGFGGGMAVGLNLIRW